MAKQAEQTFTQSEEALDSILEQFKSGNAAIEYKRQKEAGGLGELQKYFGVRVAHKGFVTCIQ